MQASVVRWGILGAAEIARKNWKAITCAGNSVVTAVAGRDLERTRQFAAQCQAEAPMPKPPEVLDDYAQLLARPDVDAVYIPLPTGVRRAWVMRAAAAGKHIVCEKPCAPSAEDLREMLAACRGHGVQFMDGVMFVHSRRFESLRHVLDDGESVGAIRRIVSAFSFRAPPEFYSGNIRAHSQLEPHGCLGDLGWYCIRLALWALQWRMPRRVAGRLLAERSRADSPAPVPAEFSGELIFEGGVSAGFFCSFLAEHQQWAVISGERGYARLADFVLPFEGSELEFQIVNAAYSISGCDFSMEARQKRVAVPEFSQGRPAAQESNLFRNFANAILSGARNEGWPAAALQTQIVLDACLKSAQADGQAVEVSR